jgi:hypothetical protein
MLTLRQSQLRALAEPRIQKYIQQTIEFVRAEFPDEFARRREQGVEDLVRRALADAEAYGLPSSVDVTGLLSLMIIFGHEDFVAARENAWIKDILESDIISPADKIGMILDELS